MSLGPPEVCRYCEGIDPVDCPECQGDVMVQYERAKCPDCGHEIDPAVCHCGDAIDDHGGMSHNHSPVPIGCQCHRAPE